MHRIVLGRFYPNDLRPMSDRESLSSAHDLIPAEKVRVSLFGIEMHERENFVR